MVCDLSDEMSTEAAEKPVQAEPAELEALDAEGLRAELQQARELLRERDDSLAGQREQILRLHADFENYKRRQQQNQENDTFVTRERVVGNVLPLLDNLERALAALEQTGDVKALGEGVSLILRQMRTILEKEGLEAIPSDGQLFDPNLHHAVMMEERDDVEDHMILETLQKGYKLGNRTLRPALVKVARATTSGPAATD